MARREKRAARGAERLRSLLEAGDHRAARAEARALRADPAADAADGRAAAAALVRLAPEPGAVWAGVAGVAIAVAIAAWTVLRG